MEPSPLPIETEQRQSFHRAAWMLYGLACLFPYLIGVYLVTELEIDMTYTIVNILSITLVLILLGALMVESFSKRLSYLAARVSVTVQDGMPEKLLTKESDVEEVYELAAGFNAMVGEQERHKKRAKVLTAQMLSYVNDLDVFEKRLREESLIRANLSRYVSKDVVDELIRNEKATFQNVECTATVLFADIRGFTTISEDMDPGDVISMLNNYFGKMVPIIFKHGGVLDKFVGDELMAVFRDHPHGERAPMRAIRTAIHMLAVVEDMKGKSGSDYSRFEVGIGINTGRVVIGNVGSDNRKDYTAIGDTVNVAARFEQIASGQDIIVGEETYEICKEKIPMQAIGEIALKNRAASVRGYRVLKNKIKQA